MYGRAFLSYSQGQSCPYVYHCKNKSVVLTHSGLPQLQLQLSALYYHGMCASLQCVINPYAVNYDSNCISYVLESSESMGTTETCQQSQTEVECKLLITCRQLYQYIHSMSDVTPPQQLYCPRTASLIAMAPGVFKLGFQTAHIP